ncbi:MAG: cation diffusion facilitator family transporter [Firmicutes bacterium]|nr:cation diffusion facilitator family transporter [Bacillota bacterium]
MDKQDYMSQQSGVAKIVLKVAIIGIFANIILVSSKVIVGSIFGNLAVISDGVHSAADLITQLFVIIAVFISSPKRDKKHNYGHEKIESLMVMFFALFLSGVAGLFIWQGIQGIISPDYSELNWYLIGVVILTIVVKEALFWYGMHHAKRTRSQMLKADAWHSRADSLTSIAVLIGLVCSAFIGTNIVESIAVLVVAVFILRVAFNILKPAINQLIDRAADKNDEDKIVETASSVNGVIKVDEIRTRLFGSAILVDLDIHVDGKLSVEQGHDIAQAVQNKLESDSDLRIKHCNVHVNPCKCDHDK